MHVFLLDVIHLGKIGSIVWECECEIREIKVKKRNEEGRIGRRKDRKGHSYLKFEEPC
jgi:hypothetical protein